MLQSVDVQPIPGKGMQVTMTLSGPASDPLDFTIDNPARISFDLPNTGLALDQRRIDVHSGGLDSILAAEASGRSRVVLNLDRLMPWRNGARPRVARTYPSVLPWLTLDRIYVRGFKVHDVSVPKGIEWAQRSDHMPLIADLEVA